MQLSKLAASLNCDLLFLHAPRPDLVKDGINRLSRETAMSLRGPSCNTLHAMATTLDWKLSVDLFATTSYAITARFFSRFPEPLSEFESPLE